MGHRLESQRLPYFLSPMGRGSNLLGQTLEHVRKTLCEKTPPISDSPLTGIAPSPKPTWWYCFRDRPNHPNPFQYSTYHRIPSQRCSLGLHGFGARRPQTGSPRGDQPLMSEQGPGLISGVVIMDDATLTTLLSLTSGASATSRFRCRALLDTGSPQSFMYQGAFEQMVATGAAAESYIRSTSPRSWSGFGSQEPLDTNRQARLTVQFYHNDAPSTSLTVWIYIVPNKTIRCPLLLGRVSWIRFHSRSYQTLASTSDGRVFG